MTAPCARLHDATLRVESEAGLFTQVNVSAVTCGCLIDTSGGRCGVSVAL